MKHIIFTAAVLYSAAVLFFSCATADAYVPIDSAVSSGAYGNAAAAVESEKNTLYGKNSAILYYLDGGMLHHYAESYDESIRLLQDGEQAIQDAYTKSVTQTAASLFINDTTLDYAGEDYEDIYINAFNALNYYHMGDIDGALVEVRRMNEKLEYLTTKYAAMKQKLQEEAEKESGGSAVQSPEFQVSKFANSALGRYLSMLFYRGTGGADDARIDREWLQAAYANAPEIYNFPLPASVDQELNIPSGKARLNVIGFGGLSPIKRENIIRIPIGIGLGEYIKIALPELQYRPSQITRIAVVLDGGETFNLEKIENMEAVSRETFQSKIGLLTFKTTLRATVKAVSAKAASDIGKNMADSDDSNVAMVGNILKLVGAIGKVTNELSEQADLRASRYFPGNAYVGGITLEPGTYSFTINYYGNNGLLESIRKQDVKVDARRLNLTEVVCLK
ncbi:MAG: hypothetical protein LBG05_05685 [Treponema sp.]|jgi:hypothetical protein|nr:hypothetical protein [Treponema sp.]